MSLAELLPAARALDATDKLRLIRVLAEELAPGPGESDDPPALPSLDFLAYTPLEAYGAAYVMQQMLKQSKGES